MVNTVTSIRLSQKTRKQIEHYKDYFCTRKSKIITYAFYELFSKKLIDLDLFVNFLENNVDNIELEKKNDSILLRDEHISLINQLKDQIEFKLGKKITFNKFVGYLLEYYFLDIAFYEKKNNDSMIDDLHLGESSQIGLYINKSLKKLLTDLCGVYNLAMNMLVLDALNEESETSFFEQQESKEQIGIHTSEKERIMIFIPTSIHEKLKSLPFTFSSFSDIKLFNYVRKYNLYEITNAV